MPSKTRVESQMGAVISDCGQYRYSLNRSGWMGGTGNVLFVMLNPSTADASEDDPTIRRCIRFARDWGFASLSVGNLYAYRATKPDDLGLLGQLAVGERARGNHYGPIYRNVNDNWLRSMALQANQIVVAWGANEGPVPARAARATEILTTHFGPFLKALGLTKAGHPRHPLYVRADADLIDYPAQPALQPERTRDHA